MPPLALPPVTKGRFDSNSGLTSFSYHNMRDMDVIDLDSWRSGLVSGEVYVGKCCTVTDERPKPDSMAGYRIVQK
jgi:hypothetical protein